MLIDQLKTSLSNMQNLRTRSIRVDKKERKVTCVISYPNISSVEKSVKEQIVAIVKSYVPKGYSCFVTFGDDTFTPLSFKKVLVDYLKARFPVYSNISKEKIDVTINANNIDVTFTVGKITKNSLETNGILSKLAQYFVDYTSYNVYFYLQTDDSDSVVGLVEDQEKLVRLSLQRELFRPMRYFSIENVTKHIGKEIADNPMYIADVRKEMTSCVLCGVVSQKSTKASKSNPNMYVCKFNLTDETNATMPCIMFVEFKLADANAVAQSMGKAENEAQTIARKNKLANEKKMRKIMDIYDGMPIVVRGKVSYSKFSERLEMCVYDMCKCTIKPLSCIEQFSREPLPTYQVIAPTKYEEFRQLTFVSNFCQTSDLSKNNYVMLHFNTTGFNKINDKLYAICAVRINDGRLTESLFTYLNPEVNLSDKQLQIAETTTQKLLFAPTITECIADLYKFIQGCVLVGDNIEKVLPIINYYANPVGFNFSNSVISQNDLLEKLFDNSVFTNRPNFAKLEELAKFCKVPFVNADFCKYSALTLAKCICFVGDNAK